jgi:hypothetical protein
LKLLFCLFSALGWNSAGYFDGELVLSNVCTARWMGCRVSMALLSLRVWFVFGCCEAFCALVLGAVRIFVWCSGLNNERKERDGAVDHSV